jgi:hypothetical protein
VGFKSLSKSIIVELDFFMDPWNFKAELSRGIFREIQLKASIKALHYSWIELSKPSPINRLIFQLPLGKLYQFQS